jgi:hypothetical protein
MGPLHRHKQAAPSARRGVRRPEAGQRAIPAMRVLPAVLVIVASVTAIEAGAQSAPPLDTTTAVVGGYAPSDRRLDGRGDAPADIHGVAAPADATPRAVAAGALPAALADSSGHAYELVPLESENIRSAIDLSVAHMNFIVRPIARRRLVKANRLAEHITFAVDPDTVRVTFDGMNPIVTPRDGRPAPWVRGETRERYDVHIESAGDTLRQVIATDDGQRENDFEFLDGGARIALHVVLTAERLPIPLRYTLVYRRVVSGE